MGTMPGLQGRLLLGEHPPLFGRRSHWAQGMDIRTHPDLCVLNPPTGTSRAPIPQRRLPGMGDWTGSSWALPTAQVSCDGQLWNDLELRTNPRSAPYSHGVFGLDFLTCKTGMIILTSQDCCEKSWS